MCDKVGFRWGSVSVPAMFLWTSHSFLLSTYINFVFGLTFLQMTTWLPAVTSPTCCPAHKHGETARKSLCNTIKWGVEVPELYYTLLPIMLPRKSHESFVSLSYLNQSLLQKITLETWGGIGSTKVTQLLPKGEGLDWMMVYVISTLLKKAVKVFANTQCFRVCFAFLYSWVTSLCKVFVRKRHSIQQMTGSRNILVASAPITLLQLVLWRRSCNNLLIS